MGTDALRYKTCGPDDWCYCTPRCVGHRPYIDYEPVKVIFSSQPADEDEYNLSYNGEGGGFFR